MPSILTKEPGYFDVIKFKKDFQELSSMIRQNIKVVVQHIFFSVVHGNKYSTKKGENKGVVLYVSIRKEDAKALNIQEGDKLQIGIIKHERGDQIL